MFAVKAASADIAARWSSCNGCHMEPHRDRPASSQPRFSLFFQSSRCFSCSNVRGRLRSEAKQLTPTSPSSRVARESPTRTTHSSTISTAPKGRVTPDRH
ncbi:hypothetical protein C8Q80DRAFT_755742 [Daedaleopsis nitida]|nr:hypothetical protein C8Q80DRAFT_755742 [Daedaleopsis nitida]